MSERTFHPRRGFTLIELIVAMGMVAILSVSLYASLRIAFRAQESAETAIEPSRTAELAMQFLRTDLQNALTPNGVLTGSFEGTAGQDDRGHEADDLVFFSTADAPLHVDGNGDVKQIELAVIQPQNSSDHMLVRRITRNVGLTQTAPNPDEEVLCRGVDGFTLMYYDGSEWVNTWDSTTENNELPVAVQITLELDRTTNSGQIQPYRYTRVFPLPCSNAMFDPAVNPNL